MSVYIHYSTIDRTENTMSSPIQSCLVIGLLKFTNVWNQITVVFVQQEKSTHSVDLTINIKDVPYLLQDKLEAPVTHCQLPVYYDNQYFCVAGLCSVLRQIIKCSPDSNYLLGFRENCLSACAEQSAWTKFCEIDSVICVNNFFNQNNTWISHIKHLESKLQSTLKIHDKVNNRKALSSDKRYCDSTQFSLSDFILMICVHILCIHTNESLLTMFPHVQKWYKLVLKETSMSNILSLILKVTDYIVEDLSLLETPSEHITYETEVRSITKAQKARKFASRSSDAMKFIKNIQPRIKQNNIGYGNEIEIKIEDIPYFALPESGDLPQDRVERKWHQLVSMAKAIKKICGPGDTIVDFCSGGGHLGLLVAHLIPHCNVILLDNKSQSLSRAQTRAQKLKLTNLYIIQSNVDYFVGSFQIGVCLHACGVASDLVMKMCVLHGADMVVSPCCYGKIQTCHTVQYPRSQWLREEGISQHDHHLMSHCADREAPEWMNWVDADRLEWALENGYNVFLGKLTPLNCTPKNNLLVASKKVQFENCL